MNKRTKTVANMLRIGYLQKSLLYLICKKKTYRKSKQKPKSKTKNYNIQNQKANITGIKLTQFRKFS